MSGFFNIGANAEKFEKLEKMPTKLADVAEKLFQGLITGADPVFILKLIESKKNIIKLHSKALDGEVKIEAELLRPLLKGKEIRRYSAPEIENMLIFPYQIAANKAELMAKEVLESQYPLGWDYLLRNKEKLTIRDISGDTKLWWQFGRNQNIVEMGNPKLITQVLASRSSYTADLEGRYYFVGGGNAGGYGIKLKNEYENLYYYVLGVLNSDPIDKYLQHISTQFRGGFYSYAKRFIEKLPIYLPDKNEPAKFALCQKIEELVKQILDLRKNSKTGDAEFLEKKIDAMVEEIYLG